MTMGHRPKTNANIIAIFIFIAENYDNGCSWRKNRFPIKTLFFVKEVSSPESRLSVRCGEVLVESLHYSHKGVSFERGPSYQASVDVWLGEEFASICGLAASSVKD